MNGAHLHGGFIAPCSSPSVIATLGGRLQGDLTGITVQYYLQYSTCLVLSMAAAIHGFMLMCQFVVSPFLLRPPQQESCACMLAGI